MQLTEQGRQILGSSIGRIGDWPVLERRRGLLFEFDDHRMNEKGGPHSPWRGESFCANLF
jgi:hypothetical protein